MQEKVKYLIVGQGLVGTWMSYYLSEQNIPFKIINDPNKPAATKVASGVINPVTGRRIVQTWIIDNLLPFAIQAYTSLQEKLNTQFIQHAPIIVVHPSAQMKESFDYRLDHDNVYLAKQDVDTWKDFFKSSFGMGKINACYWIDLINMLEKWNDYLVLNNHLIEDCFQETDMTLLDTSVQWKNIQADYIIFCDGMNSASSSYFKCLPFAPNKGEALIVRIKGLPKNIFTRTLFLLFLGRMIYSGSAPTMNGHSTIHYRVLLLKRR